MNNLRRTMSYTKNKKAYFLGGLFLLLITVVSDLFRPLIIQSIIDDVIAPSTEGKLIMSTLWRLLFTYLALSLITAVGRYVSFLLLTVGANQIVKTMRDDLYRHVQKLPIRYFDDLPAGKVVARITNDTEQLRIFYVVAFGQVLTNIIYLIGIYIALIGLNVTYGMVALILVPIFAVWVKVYQKYATTYTTKIRELVSDINAKLNESIQGMPIIQSFQQEKKIKKEFEDINEEWYDYSNKYIMLDSIASWGFVGTLRNLALLLLILVFGLGSIDGTMTVTIGLLYVFVDYTTQLFNPIQGIVNQWAYLQQALTSAGRVFDLMEVPIEVDQTEHFEATGGEVAFNDVSFAYDEGKYVLKNISFQAKKGETVALVGHTGSGKSSIMNLLFRFYDPSKGTITIDGVPTTSVSRKSLRKHMGIVLQDPYLFKGTLASNIRLGEEISDEVVLAALEAVGGDTLMQHFKDGLNEKVVDKGSTLSSGQRQLISFARALAFNPDILILDEATSNVDTETEEMIQHAMDVVKEGRTTFIIAHRLSTIQNADQIIVLKNGEIMEQGSHKELLKNDGEYAKMYRTQAQKSA